MSQTELSPEIVAVYEVVDRLRDDLEALFAVLLTLVKAYEDKP